MTQPIRLIKIYKSKLRYRAIKHICDKPEKEKTKTHPVRPIQNISDRFQDPSSANDIRNIIQYIHRKITEEVPKKGKNSARKTKETKIYHTGKS